jgi:MFS family permease
MTRQTGLLSKQGITFGFLASIVVFFLAGSSAPTPLYSVYQAEWRFSPLTTTVVFGVYALAVLASLLVTGRLSDHVGRRPVLLAAIAAQAATMVVFATADGVPMLLLARVMQGLSTGAALGAVGAGLLDLDKARGAVANAVAPLTGVATGAIGSGLVVQFLPVPTHLVYELLAGVFALQWAGVLLMRETAAPAPGAAAVSWRGSLRPRFALPGAARGPMLAAIPALVAVWSLGGFYGSLGPALVRLIAGSGSLVLGGLALFVLAATASLTVLLLRAASARTLTAFGVGALFAGSGLTYLAIADASPAVLLIGTVVAGGGFGAAFQGAVRSVIPLAPAHQRAGVLSLVYVVSYLALGLPAVIAGYLVTDTGAVLGTAKGYALAVMALAAVAIPGALRRPRAAVGREELPDDLRRVQRGARRVEAQEYLGEPVGCGARPSMARAGDGER